MTKAMRPTDMMMVVSTTIQILFSCHIPVSLLQRVMTRPLRRSFQVMKRNALQNRIYFRNQNPNKCQCLLLITNWKNRKNMRLHVRSPLLSSSFHYFCYTISAFTTARATARTNSRTVKIRRQDPNVCIFQTTSCIVIVVFCQDAKL